MNKNFTKITYSEAQYSYGANIKAPRGEVVSYGKVTSKTNKHIDLELAWTKNPHCTIFGIVIPIGALHGTRRKSKVKKDIYSIGDIVAVYWDDIFAYDDKYKGTHEPTPMLTEGILSQETDQYILIDHPETLNLTDGINHPEKKPRRYYIPKSMIHEIKCVKKHE